VSAVDGAGADDVGEFWSGDLLATAATWFVVKTGVGRRPTRATWLLMTDIAAVAFRGEGTEPLTDEAEIGVPTGSLAAALIGAAMAALAASKRRSD
jgi:Na+:H+ antiporter, NhaA family